MNLSPTQKHEETERKLLPRLRFLGYILGVFSIVSLSYAIFSIDSEPIPQDTLLGMEVTESFSGIGPPNETSLFTLNSQERYRFYGVAVIFAVIGATCVIISRRKQK